MPLSLLKLFILLFLVSVSSHCHGNAASYSVMAKINYLLL